MSARLREQHSGRDRKTETRREREERVVGRRPGSSPQSAGLFYLKIFK